MRFKKIVSLILIGIVFAIPIKIFAQGKNHNFLIGYDVALFDTNVTSTKAILNYNNNQLQVIPKNFSMPFRGAQANISDENGKLLISTNGCWIADSTGNQMLNGGGLNPSSFTTSWCDSTTGLPAMHSSVILPYPDDSSKYILFHQTGNWNLNGVSSEFYYSLIDLSLNNGLGAVTQKNQIVIQDTINPGFSACKHANGRDWWVVILKDNTDIVYKILLTPLGIQSITSQHLGFTPHYNFNGQPQFSPDGNKFAYHHRIFASGGVPVTHEIRLLNFDRCTGVLSNPQIVSVVDTVSGLGLCFSPNSKYLYFSTFTKIFQVNTDTTNVQASLDTVAFFDGYAFPYNYLYTSFWSMYLAADSKIYITSGNGVIDINYINAPDSGGIACNVQQHALRVPCYTGRGNVLHPNYYLGAVVGSICDSITGLHEHLQEIQNFQIAPNPIHDGLLKITYLLPQNQSGIFEIYDLNGRVVFNHNLEPWSSLQYYNLSFLSSGLYQCVIRSGKSISSQKLVVVKN